MFTLSAKTDGPAPDNHSVLRIPAVHMPNPADLSDPPSFMRFDGGMEWHDEQGRLHSHDDRPAIINSDGQMQWYQHGVLHRDGDLPAIVTVSASRWATLEHVKTNIIELADPGLHQAVLSRFLTWTKSPAQAKDAETFSVKSMVWYQNGERHRWAGPASIRDHFLGYKPHQDWYAHGAVPRDGQANRLHEAYRATSLSEEEAWALAGDDPWVMLVLLHNRKLALSTRARGFFTLATEHISGRF